MSKLSSTVKALINASHASPGYTPSSAGVQTALTKFASDAAEKKVGLPAWVTLSVGEIQHITLISLVHMIVDGKMMNEKK